MILWVAGGRDFSDRLAVEGELRPYALPGNLLVTGSASGADTVAEQVWRKWQLPYLGVPARWDVQGKRAGYERNRIIAEGFRGLVPDLLLHFPGGDGTAMAVNLAAGLGIDYRKAGA